MSNPYLSAILSILGDIKGWILTIVGALTAVMVAKYGIDYLQGDEMEKATAKKNVKTTIIWGGGIFMLIWIATYVIEKMKAV